MHPQFGIQCNPPSNLHVLQSRHTTRLGNTGRSEEEKSFAGRGPQPTPATTKRAAPWPPFSLAFFITGTVILKKSGLRWMLLPNSFRALLIPRATTHSSMPVCLYTDLLLTHGFAACIEIGFV